MRLPSSSPFPLLDNSTEYLYGITDPELRFLHSNNLFRKQFGLKINQDTGKPFHEVVHSFQVEKFNQARENCLSNPSKVITLEIKSQQGPDEHWFRWEMSAIPGDDKNIKEISFIGTDITRQKKVEQELIKQAVLLDSISDTVVSTDLDFRITSWNLSAEMLLGFTPEEVLNRPISDFFNIYTLGVSNEEARESLEKKGFWKGELSIKIKSGKKLYMLSAVSLIKNTKGEATGYLSVNQDITWGKRAKEELVIKKEEFHSFMENTQAMAWINDENGTLYYMNSLYKKNFGLTDKAIGKNIFSCFPNEMTIGWRETDHEVLNNNARIDRVEKGTDAEGNDIFFQVYKFPVKTLSGKKLVGGQAINITEKKKSRMELEKQKNQFHSFMENTPAMGWINDEEGTLYYMNSLFKKAFGLTDEVIGKNIFDFYPESMRPACRASDEMVLNTNASVEVFEEGTNADGNDIYYKVFKFPVRTTEGKRLIGGQAIDITRETTTEIDLVKQKNQFTSFMENAPLLAWIIDEQGITRYMNSMFRSLSGFTDDHIGKDNHDEYPEGLKEMARHSIREVLSTNRELKYQYQYTDENGKLRYFDASKFPIYTPDGKKLVGGQSIEVTDIIEANKQVIKEKNRFQSFMENAPLLAWIVDEEGVLQYMNSMFMSAFHYSEDRIGKEMAERYAQDVRERSMNTNREALEKNKPVEFLNEWKDENGILRYYRTFKFPLTSPDGKRLIGGLSEDITEKMLIKKELEAMHERFELASKATRDVIWDWDYQTNKIKRFGGSNAFFNYRVVGDLMDFNNDNIHPEDAGAAEDSLQAALNSTADRWMSEFRYKCSEGTYKNVIDQAYIIRDEKGKPIRLIGSMQDVTEERRLQKEVLDAELKKKQDMVTAVLEAQETERKELSDELHDNVNQLLASALLFLKIVAKEPVGNNEMVVQSIDYINKAVNEIRDISHALSPGNLKQNGLAAALNDLATGLDIPGKFTVLFGTENFREDRLSKELQLSLYRIVQENINNILKHAEATVVDIKLEGHDDKLRLTITDNGKGFDMETAIKGLGLVNIFNRAQTFGGKAELDTTPGKGSVLTVNIPVNQ